MADKKLLDPADFIITRKRKQYKFAKFFNSPLCFEFDEWKKTKVDVVEVGAGTGLFSVELASRYPDKTFLAIDVKGDRLQKGAYEAQLRGLTNVQFLRARADQLPECIASRSVESLWVTFPDPFPKKRAAGRRLTHPTFLTFYGRLLKKDGAMLLKHDNLAFFQWSLEQLVTEHWHIAELTFDLHGSNLMNDYKIQTTYEKRWLSEGGVTHLVKAEYTK